MQICNVCSGETPKYRCPACRIRYCSLSCYKTHKANDTCQPPKQSVPPPAQDLNGAYGNEDPWTVEDVLDDDDDHTDKVPLQRLRLLGKSEELRALLRNPHLCQLMRSVDTAESKADAMKTAMQEPLFVELSDQCLQIVEKND
ncbi:zinc finger HIT domain-containing protein 3 isoform X2 [Coregonus clupeaformis]|uniref:zinc finger HIT domain-containing protein 3 isoform X2 n=1 Tax=Coregonus clupeaformis TaxID=59861 RepID=UPI001BE0F0BC|nr:zinc finger HIT domain-containing protein 3 isoform X2 [Coregonus clupeaformis]